MNLPVELQLWNKAYQRLRYYLDTFALGDDVQVARLAVRLLDEARALHQADPAQEPTAVTLRHAQAAITGWLARNLNEQNQPATQILAGGTIALLLSRLAQERPDTFLAPQLAPDAHDLLQRTMVVTGPDLTVSSMTPRHLDYGPMLDLARQTWHRWDLKTVSSAALFWFGIYWMCYWCLSEYL